MAKEVKDTKHVGETALKQLVKKIKTNAASATNLGMIKTGFEKTDNKYPVEIDENNNAYVKVSDAYLDSVSYGVSWIAGQADPTLTRIGNMTMHKTLPIQSKMKGCIAQPTADNPIQYYLDVEDWRWRETPVTVENVSLVATTADSATTYTITNADYFGTLQYEKQWIKLGDVACHVTSIDIASTTATVVPDETLTTGTYTMTLGAVLNGYDGFVEVEVPEFYIKSWDNETGSEQSVRISSVAVDSTWEKQPHMLVGAYKSGILRSVPENMGYLSTLSTNAAICVVNEHDYCRGGQNKADYDTNLETDPCACNLNKPATNITRAVMRTDARLSGQENMNYFQYKNLAWLFYIEYATFFCQDEVNDELTAEGYHQGGLGNGITNASYNYSYLPYCPNGFTNAIGNGTGEMSMTSAILGFNGGASTTMVDAGDSTADVRANRYRGIENIFGDVGVFLDGNLWFKNWYFSKDPSKYTDDKDTAIANADYVLNGQESPYSNTAVTLDLESNANIIARECVYNNTKYVTDFQYYYGYLYDWSGNEYTPATAYQLWAGGYCRDGSRAGLASLSGNLGLSRTSENAGFRCVKTLE